MKALLIGKDDDLDVDIGLYGYHERMFVYENVPADELNLSSGGVTVAFADAALRSKAHLVRFSSEYGGTGSWLVVPMSECDAKKYEIGTEVVFHYRKDDRIGFGSLVAIKARDLSMVDMPTRSI